MARCRVPSLLFCFSLSVNSPSALLSQSLPSPLPYDLHLPPLLHANETCANILPSLAPSLARYRLPMASFFSKLNPTPAFPRHSGPYKVGTVDVEIDSAELQDSSSAFCPASTIAFRCFYPCESPSKPNAPVYWVQTPQRSTLSAYARFLGAGNAFSDYFS